MVTVNRRAARFSADAVKLILSVVDRKDIATDEDVRLYQTVRD